MHYFNRHDRPGCLRASSQPLSHEFGIKKLGNRVVDIEAVDECDDPFSHDPPLSENPAALATGGSQFDAVREDSL